ncbi:MAG: transglycosylase SLT domain-containing protein [Desulfovibrionaceae bacterium]
MEEFCRRYGYQLEWVRTESLEKGWETLAQGKAHVFVSTGFEPESIPGELAVAQGPIYETHQSMLLGPASRPGRRQAETLTAQLAMNEDAPPLIRSLYRAASGEDAQDDRIEAESGLPRTPLRRVTLPNGPSLSLAETGSFLPWRPFHQRLRPALTLEETVDYRWYWRTDTAKLGQRLNEFFQDIENEGYLDDLRERYYGFFPEEGAYGQLWMLRNTMRTKLPLYKDLILKAAAKYQLDPLMLVAVIFQESAFDPDAVSHTGVRGLMQLTQGTADALGATDRTDPAQSILYGAKYLKMLWDGMEELDLDTWDRWALVLASYNQGVGHVYDAMLLAEQQGLKPRSWRTVKTILPLLEQEQWHSRTIFGYSRGTEGVEYVDKVRFYYYVLKGLSLLPGFQLEQLAPLVPDFRSAGLRPLLEGVRLPGLTS